MMGQNLLCKQILVFFIACISNIGFCIAQALILRPYAGFKYYNIKPDKSLPTSFDPSFHGDYNFKEGAQAISIELAYIEKSYEISFTKQNMGNAFNTFYNYGKLGAINLTKMDFSQFQFIYNRYFISNTKKRNANPFLGIGAGLGINKPNWYYADTSFGVYRTYSLIYPNEYIDVDIRTKGLAKLSYSIVFRAGLAFKIKNRERARVTATYNWGLNKMEQTNMIYYHTNTKYYGSSTSKGSQFSILASMPIYIKRWKK